MLSFVIYYLLKHPEAMSRLRAEVDSVVGDRTIAIDDIPKLPYLNGSPIHQPSISLPNIRISSHTIAVLREALRLNPTAVIRAVSPVDGDQIIGNGKYVIPQDAIVLVNAYNQHRDPVVWGEDAEEFKPERMLDGKFEAMPVRDLFLRYLLFI
jgi:cytochrome P450 / NADPH-cytochrome P450 reductase